MGAGKPAMETNMVSQEEKPNKAAESTVSRQGILFAQRSQAARKSEPM
jgi:hypothetical protein